MIGTFKLNNFFKESGRTDKFAGFNSAGFDNANSSTTNEGSQTDTHTEASKTNGHTTTQYTDQNSIGAQTNGHTENAKTDTHTDASHSDTITQGEQTNTHAETARSDSSILGAHVDEHDEDAATDVLEKAYDSTVTHIEDTSGNIGVTTSQQMAQSEIDLRLATKFYDLIINDVIKELCTLEREGVEVI